MALKLGVQAKLYWLTMCTKWLRPELLLLYAGLVAGRSAGGVEGWGFRVLHRMWKTKKLYIVVDLVPFEGCGWCFKS